MFCEWCPASYSGKGHLFNAKYRGCNIKLIINIYVNSKRNYCVFDVSPNIPIIFYKYSFKYRFFFCIDVYAN